MMLQLDDDQDSKWLKSASMQKSQQTTHHFSKMLFSTYQSLLNSKSFFVRPPPPPSGCSHYIRLSTSLTQRDFKIGDIKIQRAEAKVIEIQHHADNWIITLMKFLHWLKVRVRPSLILKSLSQTWKCVRTGGSFLHLVVASWRNLLPHRHSLRATHHFQAWQLWLTFQLETHFTFLVIYYATIFYITLLILLFMCA